MGGLLDRIFRVPLWGRGEGVHGIDRQDCEFVGDTNLVLSVTNSPACVGKGLRLETKGPVDGKRTVDFPAFLALYQARSKERLRRDDTTRSTNSGGNRSLLASFDRNGRQSATPMRWKRRW
jgi:hypothetical protein